MKCFIIIVLLGLTGQALAGGTSQCGPLLQSFTPLLQAVESMVDFVQDRVNSAVSEHPYIGNSYISLYNTFLTLTNLTFATGTSQLSGVNINYINGILNGTVSAPFISPLDCIEEYLQSYITYSQNISQNVIDPLEPLPSPGND
jgi:hypothetical protein